MRLSATALALSTLCLAVSACGEKKYTAEFIPTPPERLVCEPTATRPTIPHEYTIDWSKVTTVPQARSEFEKYRAVIYTRENVVAGYVLVIEGAHFVCFNNAQWRREFEAELAKTHPPAK